MVLVGRGWLVFLMRILMCWSVEIEFVMRMVLVFLKMMGGLLLLGLRRLLICGMNLLVWRNWRENNFVVI